MESVKIKNRELLAMLLDKTTYSYKVSLSSSMYHKLSLTLLTSLVQDPYNRLLKDSMYRHPIITQIIRRAFFDGILSDGIQHAAYFDDSLPSNEADQEQEEHISTFSLVTLTLVLSAVC